MVVALGAGFAGVSIVAHVLDEAENRLKFPLLFSLRVIETRDRGIQAAFVLR